MACFCRGGPSCCMRQNDYPAPGPFRCPDCGTWWTGYEHRCRYDFTVTSGTAQIGNTVFCKCPPNRGDNYAGNCPIHDGQTTFTFTEALGVRS